MAASQALGPWWRTWVERNWGKLNKSACAPGLAWNNSVEHYIDVRMFPFLCEHWLQSKKGEDQWNAAIAFKALLRCKVTEAAALLPSLKQAAWHHSHPSSIKRSSWVIRAHLIIFVTLNDSTAPGDVADGGVTHNVLKYRLRSCCFTIEPDVLKYRLRNCCSTIEPVEAGFFPSSFITLNDDWRRLYFSTYICQSWMSNVVQYGNT